MTFSTYLSFLQRVPVETDPDWIVEHAVESLQEFPGRLVDFEWVRHWSVVAARLVELRAFPEAHLACRRGLARGPNEDLFKQLAQIGIWEGDLEQAAAWFEHTSDSSLARKGVQRQLDEFFRGATPRPVRLLDEPQPFSVIALGPGWEKAEPLSDLVMLHDPGCDDVLGPLEKIQYVHLDDDLQGIVWASRYQFQRLYGEQIMPLPAHMADDLIAVTLRRSAFEQLQKLVASKPEDVPEAAIVGLLDGLIGFYSPSLVDHESKFVQQ